MSCRWKSVGVFKFAGDSGAECSASTAAIGSPRPARPRAASPVRSVATTRQTANGVERWDAF